MKPTQRIVQGRGSQRTEIAAVSLPSPRSRRLCKLLAIFLFLTGNYTSAEEEFFLRRTKGDSILFPIDKDFGNNTRSIEWTFQTKNLFLLKIQSGQSKPSWINNHERYIGRLSVHDMKSLKIMNLNPDDSGQYEIHIKSISGKINSQNYALIVSGSNMKTWNQWFLLGNLVLVMIFLS